MNQEPSPHPYREFERAGWESAAGVYADTFEAATRLYAGALADAAGVRAGSKVIDVACGTGFVTAMSTARGASVIGVDFSPAMIAEAGRIHPTLEFRVADAEALPYPDASFDAVLINFGVHHFPFPVRALAEARRVLGVGGRLSFTVWASPDEHALQGLALEAVRQAGDVSATLPVPPEGQINETHACMRLLTGAGFDVSTCTAEKIKAQLFVASVADLQHMMQAGTVRLSTLIRSQPLERREAILAGIARAATKYQDRGQLNIPIVAILATGTKR